MADVVLMGPPGSGKGTQAKRLVARGGWLHLSTGEMFREEAKRDSELGRLAESYLDRGEYVPDEVTVDMVRERISAIPASTRILFDGFPRTVAQADALDKLLAGSGRSLGAVALIDAPHDELVKRMAERARKEARTDDTPGVIADRLEVYRRKTAPLVQHYERRGLLRRVNGLGGVDEIAGRLAEALRERGAPATSAGPLPRAGAPTSGREERGI